jgi:hypothetical protein
METDMHTPKRRSRGESLYSRTEWIVSGVNNCLMVGILIYAGWHIAKWIAALVVMLVFG